MTDYELLELAAKAAGITCTWRDVIRCRIAEFQTIKYTKHSGFFADGKEWNPLEDDGDALRLAVKLNMSINIPANSKIRADVISYLDLSVCIREIGDDPYAATRRAIVRAAAEMGRDIK